MPDHTPTTPQHDPGATPEQQLIDKYRYTYAQTEADRDRHPTQAGYIAWLAGSLHRETTAHATAHHRATALEDELRQAYTDLDDYRQRATAAPADGQIGTPAVAAWAALLTAAQQERDRYLSMLTDIGDAISPTGERPAEALGTLVADVQALDERCDRTEDERDQAIGDRDAAQALTRRYASERDHARQQHGRAVADLVQARRDLDHARAAGDVYRRQWDQARAELERVHAAGWRLADRMEKRADDGDNPADCTAMAEHADELRAILTAASVPAARAPKSAAEPKIWSHITDTLPDSHPLAWQQIRCACGCGTLLHGTPNECMQTWIETGQGPYRLGCWTQAIGDGEVLYPAWALPDDQDDAETEPSLARRCAHPACQRAYQADKGPAESGWTRLRGLTVLCPAHPLAPPPGAAPAVDPERIAQAVGDPGSIVGRCLGPSWGVGQDGYADVQETVTRWATRAVLHVLAATATEPALVEWSIRWPSGDIDRARTYTEAGARRYAAELDAEVVTRSVGPWTAAAPAVDHAQPPATPAEGDRTGGDDHGPQGDAEPSAPWEHTDDDGDQIVIYPTDPGARWTIRTRHDCITMTPAAAIGLHTWLGGQFGEHNEQDDEQPTPTGPQDIPQEWLLPILRQVNIDADLDLVVDALLDHARTDPYRQAIRSAYRIGFAAAMGCEITVSAEGDAVLIGDRPESADAHDQDHAAGLEQMLKEYRDDYATTSDATERAEILAELLADWYAAWPDTAVADPHQPIAQEIVAMTSETLIADTDPGPAEIRARALDAATRLMTGIQLDGGALVRDLEQTTIGVADRWAEWIATGDYDWTDTTPADAVLLGDTLTEEETPDTEEQPAHHAYHWGRSWSPTGAEDVCPCPKAPCGYVIDGQEDPDCELHTRDKTRRGGHPAARCPGRPS